jgi:exodeoxyribonuclease VII large subunit
MRLRLERGRARVDSLERQLAHLSPLAILERGYAIVQNADEGVIRSSRQARVGEALRVRLHQGQLGVRVEERIEEKE